MQNAYTTVKSFFALRPSVRPEIEIHALDYDFPQINPRPIVRAGSDTGSHTLVPDKPALAQNALPSQNVTSSPSFKAPSVPLTVRHVQQNDIAGQEKALSSVKPAFHYTALTLVDAVQSGCLDSVMRHIDAGLAVNVGPTHDAPTPLMFAASKGHEAIVRLLLNSGAYVNLVQPNGLSALMLAAKYGHTTVAQILLDQGATIDKARTDGMTALMLAAKHGHTEVARILLDRGAAVDKDRADGEAALHLAAGHGHPEVVRILLDRGADIEKIMTCDMNAWLSAKRNTRHAAMHAAMQALHDRVRRNS